MKFSKALLEELHQHAPSLIEEDGDYVVIKHLYIERRMEPLNIYLGKAEREDRQDRIQPAEGFAEKLTGVDILEYRVEKRGKLVVFHTH